MHAAAIIVQATELDGLVEHDKLRFENARTDRGE